jgi:hypothetical protein
MDDEFAFSPYETRAEWEAENLRREEFSREFDRQWKEREERIARGEPVEPIPLVYPDPSADVESNELTSQLNPPIDDEEKELPQ